MYRSNDSRLLSRLPLAIILLSGAVLRLYNLGTPSLWWDEILVPMTANHNLKYIFDFCSSAEMHPPLFYLVSKAMFVLGKTDFALRFLPALLGIASIYVLYRVVLALVDEETALLAAAFLAVNGLDLLISREIRPYALQVILFLAAWRLIVRLTETGRWRDLVLLCCVNTTLFWLHYFTYHMVFAQGVVLTLCLFDKSSPLTFRQLAAFCAATLLVAGPVYVWIFQPSYGTHIIFRDSHETRWEVLELIGHYLGEACFFFRPHWARWAASGLALAGFAVLAVRKPRLAAICLLLAAIPLANVLAMGTSAYFSVWHVAFITPFIALFSAVALSWLPGRKVAAPLIAAAGAILILTVQHPRYYETDSYHHHTFKTLYKPVAARLSALLSPNALTVASNPGFANGIRWYLDQSQAPDPFRSQALEPGGATATLQFVSALEDFGTLGGDESSFLAAVGRPEKVEKALNATIYTFHLDRQPVATIGALPQTFAFSSGLTDFYTHVFRLKDVAVCPMPKVGVTALRNGQPGTLEFALDNASGDKPVHFFINFQYLNVGTGSQIGLFARFDDEPPTPLAGSIGPDAKHQTQASFTREKPFKRVVFIVEMRCNGDTAQYHGGDLETLSFNDLEVIACAADDTAPSQKIWERHDLENRRLNYFKEGFLPKSSTTQTIHYDSNRNMADTPSEERPGWSFLSPRDASKPAVLTLEVKPNASTVFYPRLCGTDTSVQIFEEEPDGTSRLVFIMAGVPTVWTPLGAQYPFVLPKGPAKRTLRIELRGRYSQIWHDKAGDIFF